MLGFFTIQYAKLRVLVFYYNFFDNFCDFSKFKELEKDTVSMYLALAEKKLTDCFRLEMRKEGAILQSHDCDEFHSRSIRKLFPLNWFRKTQQTR